MATDPGAADFVALSRALKAAGEGTGKDSLRGQMLAEIRAIAKPILEDERRAVLALDSTAKGSSSANRAAAALRGRKNVTEKSAGRALGRSGLRASIARSLRIVVRDSGNTVGVRITTDGSRLPANERGIPRGLDSAKGWRHPVFGTDSWVTQYGNPPGWFLSTANAHKPDARRRLEAVFRKYADELAARARRGA